MRHNNKTNALGRKSAHRKSMMSNMAASLILHKRIKTTVAKAKALRVFIEPIITKSKEDTTHSRRLAFGYLQDKQAVAELFREVSPKVHDRPGGYTRILKLGQRLGDAAEVCYIELVDFNETMLTAKAAAEAKVTRRSRRTSRKKPEVVAAAKPATKTVEEVSGSGKDTDIPAAETLVEEEVTGTEEQVEAVQDDQPDSIVQEEQAAADASLSATQTDMNESEEESEKKE